MRGSCGDDQGNRGGIGANESGLVDRICFEVRCWRGSTSAAVRLVLVDRIKDRIVEQIVSSPVPRIMVEIAADGQVIPHGRRILEQIVERVNVMSQERILGRILEQLVENSVCRCGQESWRRCRLVPPERVQRVAEPMVEVPTPKLWKISLRW